MRKVGLVGWMVLAAALSGCGGDGDSATADAASGETVETMVGGDTGLVAGGAMGACAKGGGDRCIEFEGSFTQDDAQNLCNDAGDTFAWGAGCVKTTAVGACALTLVGTEVTVDYYYSNAAAAQSACASLGGSWAPA